MLSYDIAQPTPLQLLWKIRFGVAAHGHVVHSVMINAGRRIEVPRQLLNCTVARHANSRDMIIFLQDSRQAH